MVTQRRFSQAGIKIGGKIIRTEKFKYDIKQDSETYQASRETHPYGKAFGAHTYEINLTGVDPFMLDFFLYLDNVQGQVIGDLNDLPSISIHAYDDHGVLYTPLSFTGASVESISGENAAPFDVKMEALKRSTTYDPTWLPEGSWAYYMNGYTDKKGTPKYGVSWLRNSEARERMGGKPKQTINGKTF